MVWSDPEDVETWAISPRGAGWLFGAKVTNEVRKEKDKKVDKKCQKNKGRILYFTRLIQVSNNKYIKVQVL